MINKQSIWFTFLFSIILVLSIFYITMDTEKLDELILDVDTNDTTLVVNESTELVALRVQDDEETLDTINELQNILLDDQLLSINSNKRIESSLEKIIKDEFKLDSFVKLKNNNVTVFIDSSDHDYKLANDIIRRLSKEFKEERYITVKFG